MNKRTFLKTSGGWLAGGLISRFMDAEQQTAKRTNWAGNLEYSTDHLYLPKTVDEARKVVTSCEKLKPLGARHSFNRIADSKYNQVSLKNIEGMHIDRGANTVTVEGAVTYGKLSPYLYENGYALHNLASLPHISVIGACATATHGSGVKNGNLSTAVTGMRIMGADGNTVSISREEQGDHFDGAVVHLGALGLVTSVTLKLLPKFDARQVVYQNLSIDQLEKNLRAIFSSGYSVSMFTDWAHHRITQVWIKSRVEPGESFEMKPDFYGATLQKEKLHPITGHPAESCTEQMGVPGPWYERLPHFRMNFTPSSGNELQTEYFVPLDKGYEAIRAVEKLHAKITPLLFVTELRTIDEDNLWMSPAYKRPSMAIHFTWKPQWPEVKALLPSIEKELEPFDAKPHWAKLFTMAPSRLQSLYPKLPDFKSMVASHDPNGKFRNEFLETNLYS